VLAEESPPDVQIAYLKNQDFRKANVKYQHFAIGRKSERGKGPGDAIIYGDPLHHTHSLHVVKSKI
jgi:hypothetical protein